MGIIYQKQLNLHLATGRYLEFPAHIHSHCEIQYIKSGSLEACIDGKYYTVNKNEMLFVMPYQVHSFVSKCPNESDTMFISSAHLGRFAEMLPENPVVNLGSNKRIEMCRNLVEYLYSEFDPDTNPGVLLRKINEEVLQNPVALQIAKAYINIAMECVMWVPREMTGHDTTRKVLEYCMRNYDKDLSLGKLAEQIGVSSHTVTRVFSNICRCSFRKYINNIRLSEASELLSATDTSVAEISEKCGFGTQRTFNRVFLAEKGMTPLEYRNAHRSSLVQN